MIYHSFINKQYDDIYILNMHMKIRYARIIHDKLIYI